MRLPWLLLAVGCSSSAQNAPPSHCPAGIINGTYLVQWTTVSGDCGTMPDSLVLETPGAATMQSACTNVTAVPSANGCRVDVQETCPANGGESVTSTGYLELDDAQGNHAHGELTMQVLGAAGQTLCLGTYDVTYTRQ